MMKPNNKKHHVGIEIEFYCSVDSDLIRLALGLELSKFCEYELGGDSSIKPPKGYQGYELRLLIEQSNVTKAMEALSLVFSLIKAKVNKSCGLHVHLDCRNRSREILFQNLVSCQPLFISMQPPTRRTSRWCKPNINKDFNGHHTREDRYSVINSHSFNEHKTIEVRVHKGTVNTKEIGSWVNLLVRIAGKRKEMTPVLNTEDLIKNMTLNKDEEKYIIKKIKRYNKDIAA